MTHWKVLAVLWLQLPIIRAATRLAAPALRVLVPPMLKLGHSRIVAAPEREGTMVSFCGLQRHAGRRITRGLRYILAGFVRCPRLKQAGEALFPR